TAMHVAAVVKLEDTVLPAVETLKKTMKEKSDTYMSVVKIGRTHLQDATPITLGQEMSGWHRMLEKTQSMIKESKEHIKDLAIRETAVVKLHYTYLDFPEQ